MNATDLYLPILFWTFAIASVGGSLAILFVKDIVRCAFLLMFSFSGIAGIYLLLGAEFLAFTQILIYVGGILILILFGVMLTQRHPLLAARQRVFQLVVPGALCAAILLAGLVYVSLKVEWVTKPGDLDRVFLESVLVDAPEGTKPDDPHSIDGWTEVDEKTGGVVVHDEAGNVTARFPTPEGDEDGQPVARGITRLWLLTLAEDGRVARDYRGREVKRTLYGRLSKAGAGWVLKNRVDGATLARFEPRKFQIPEASLAALLGTEVDKLPEELLAEEEGGDVEVTLFANVAGEREVIDASIPFNDPSNRAYPIAAGVKAEPSVDQVDEFVTSIGPAMDETPAAIGKALMTDFLLPFEVSSVLLLAALIGATLIARRGGAEGAH